MFYSLFKNESKFIYITIYIFNNKESTKFKSIFFFIYITILFTIYYKCLNFGDISFIQKGNENNINIDNNIIEIDNELKEIEYEENLNFSEYTTNIKVIAFYLPNIYLSKFSKIMQNESKFSPIHKDVKRYYQQSLELNEFNNKNINLDSNNNITNFYNLISKQIDLAKNHGIYGFAFCIHFYSSKIIIDKYIYTFLENNNIDFNYLFILRHRNIYYRNEKLFILKKFNKNFPNSLISEMKSYLNDKRYIKMGTKPIICIDILKKRKKLEKLILSWRKEAKNIGLKDLFIITSVKQKNLLDYELNNIYDSGYEYLPNFWLKTNLKVNFLKNYTFFAGLIYNDMNFKNNKNLYLYRGSTLSNDIKIRRSEILGEYSPELFYIMNKMIINKTLNNCSDSNKFIFVNSWNNYFDGAYLEPDYRFGFGGLNALSKSIFNLNFKNMTYHYSNLENSAKIAIQAHIFHVDLVEDIIKITNNIPVKFDLYITTNNLYKRRIIKEYMKKNSKANKYEIKIVKNKGRDILPLLIQMRNVFYKYKYFCHIHSKKTLQNPNYGYKWRLYLYKNLLGSKETISEILSDFESDGKLGFIFPETFYEAKESALKLDKPLVNSINYLIKKILGEFKMGNQLDFPAGDMFWARSKAVYQIFQINLENDIFLEGKGPQTILFAIERIWLYIVKYNGYYYKKKCGYF